ncbi:hypothetical protein N2W54_004366 [Lotmaria passim]
MKKQLYRSCSGALVGFMSGRTSVFRMRHSRALIASTVDATTSAVTSTATRNYHWPYPDNFLPEGATTSSFQSSPVPSVRERIVREYALSPLFGRRTPCCVLGFTDTAASLVDVKGELRRCIAQVLGKAEVEVELGPLRQMKEMLLHRSGTDESPRLADELWGRPDAGMRRRERYARLPVQARTLVEVFLPGEEVAAAEVPVVGERRRPAARERSADAGEDEGAYNDGVAEAEAAILAHGWYLQEQLYQYMTAGTTGSGNRQENEEIGEDEVEAGVAMLHDGLGVVYCEVPAIDESGFVFDQLHGKEVDADTASRVVDRWTRRVAQQQRQQEEEAAKKKPSQSA